MVKPASNNRLGVKAAGLWSHRLFVRCCPLVPAGIYLFSFSFNQQHYIINLASAAGAEVFQIPPQRQAVHVACKLSLPCYIEKVTS
jgi:hypothetical protein